MYKRLPSCHEVVIIVLIMYFRSLRCLVSVKRPRHDWRPSIPVELYDVPQILANFAPVIEEGRGSLLRLRNVLGRLDIGGAGVASKQGRGAYRDASHAQNCILLVDVMLQLVKAESLCALEMGSARRLGRLILVTCTRLRCA
jgi:hypothetical protein